MKKLVFITIFFALFAFAGCGSSNEITDEPTNQTDDPTNPDDQTNPTDDQTNPTDDQTNPTDEPTNPTDEPTNPTDEPTNPTDEPTNPTDEPTNPTDEPTNPTDEPTNPTDEPTNPTEPTEPEIECTGISLDASTFIPYYENVYIGFVENGILGDASSDDLIQIEFDEVAVNSYTSTNYNCTACTIVAQDNNTEDEKIYFQKNGTIVVSEYDPETMEMSAEISATLVAVTINNNYFTPDETDCITIETGVVRAEESSDHAIKTCAGITECKKGCDENEACIENCFSDISAVARTQYLNLFSTCNEAHNCENNYYCLWENCAEEEEICGMRGDTENYNIPYGEVTINGTFTYLHAEGETEILYSHALEAAFVEGTFGNNNTPVVDSEGQLLSYAKIAPFKDVPEEKNITLVQTYKKEEGKSFGPTVHIVTTLHETGTYKLGLSDWEEEARLFISNTDSEGEKICDHAFGVGTINITAISWTPGETTISVNGTAKLYSYKASPHYGGDISGTKWVACEPKN